MLFSCSCGSFSIGVCCAGLFLVAGSYNCDVVAFPSYFVVVRFLHSCFVGWKRGRVGGVVVGGNWVGWEW